jgi:hypothetical protein
MNGWSRKGKFPVAARSRVNSNPRDDSAEANRNDFGCDTDNQCYLAKKKLFRNSRYRRIDCEMICFPDQVAFHQQDHTVRSAQSNVSLPISRPLGPQLGSLKTHKGKDSCVQDSYHPKPGCFVIINNSIREKRAAIKIPKNSEGVKCEKFLKECMRFLNHLQEPRT